MPALCNAARGQPATDLVRMIVSPFDVHPNSTQFNPIQPNSTATSNTVGFKVRAVQQ